MAGLTPFQVWDETYVHTKHNTDRLVLMERVDAAGREPWTWVRNQGKGRVFYTAYGHDEARLGQRVVSQADSERRPLGRPACRADALNCSMPARPAGQPPPRLRRPAGALARPERSGAWGRTAGAHDPTRRGRPAARGGGRLRAGGVRRSLGRNFARFCALRVEVGGPAGRKPPAAREARRAKDRDASESERPAGAEWGMGPPRATALGSGGAKPPVN